MARVQITSKVDIACDLLLAWRGIANGITVQNAKAREKYWKAWTGYCDECSADPYLECLSRCEQGVLLTGFAARVRTGAYGYGDQVRVQTVTQALAAISTTCQLVGKQSPVYESEGEYILPLRRLTEGFRRQDPPSIPQLAVPVELPEMAAHLAYLTKNEHAHAVGDLITIAFYFLLRSGEYTKPRMVQRNGEMVHATRTKQFRVMDVGFWKDGRILSRHSPLQELEQADSVTLKISNQKNGRTGQTLHHETTGSKGAVAALARRIHHILSNGGDEKQLICDVSANETWSSVAGSDIVAAVRVAAKALDLQSKGIDPDLIGSHSLRAGGAMALKLMGYSDSTIKKLGRWKSHTWEMYIHSQISKLHEGIAQKMSTHLPFHNIAFIEPPKA